KEPLRQHAGERRHVELHQVGEVGVDHAFERFAQRRMVASDREDAESAQQVEVSVVLAIKQILSSAAAEADVISDRAQNTDHLRVEMANMSLNPVGFALGIELRHVHALGRAVGCDNQVGPLAQGYPSYP